MLKKSFYIGNITVNIHLLSVISVMALILAESSIYSLLVVCCALIHEMGHIAAMLLCGAGISEMTILPFGAEIKMKNTVGYISELIIVLAGPYLNLLCAGLFFAVYYLTGSPEVLFLMLSSLFLAIINLIPVKSFDGGRALRCIAFSFLEYEKALKLVRASELLSLILLCIFSLIAVKLFCFNLSLIAICFYLFLFVYMRE